MTKIRVFLLALPLLAQGGLTTDAAWAQKRLDRDTFFEMEDLSDPAISPRGDRIVFTRRWIDKMTDRTVGNLWVTDVEGRRVRELTHGSWRDSSPLWSPDGERLAFFSDRDGTNQVHVLWVDTGEAAQLTHLQGSPSDLTWSPDGQRLAFSMFVPEQDKLLPIRMPSKPEGAKWAEGATAIDRLNWRRDGRGDVKPGFSHIFLLDAKLGGTPRQLTDGDYNHSSPRFSSDGKTIYFDAIRKPDADYLRGDSELHAVSVEGGEIRVLTDRRGPDRNPEVSPDGRWIAYSGYDDQRFTSHLSSLYLLETASGSTRLWAGGLPNSPNSVTWAGDSSGVYFLMGEKGSQTVQFLPLDGSPRALTPSGRDLSGLSISKSGLAATIVSDFQRPGYLATFQIGQGEFREVVDVNRDVLDGVRLGEAEELWFESKDGLKIQGWLIKPADFDPSKKYPLVLWIHGGPWSMYDVGFSWAFQNFSAEGYGVLYTNPRGSTGYGQDFVNGIQYEYPGKDYDDLMAGVDAALAKGWVDEQNLFVCGGSGGGVLTAWIVGHTDRFRAAVSMRPVINWHSFVGTTDGASWYDQFRSYPWEDPMEYARRSPLSYVANVTTPTLVMTGEADLRTPISQSEEYYRALKKLKKETLMIRMPDEYHGWRRPSHRLAQQLYLLAWFEKHRVRADGGKVAEDAAARK